MPFVRTLLLTLMLPALLLPEGAKVCLHFLLCAKTATSGCCQLEDGRAAASAQASAAATTLAKRTCCARCGPPSAAARARPDPLASKLAAPHAECCVKAPATVLLPGLSLTGHDDATTGAVASAALASALTSALLADAACDRPPWPAVPPGTSRWSAPDDAPARTLRRYSATALPLRL